MQNTGPRGQTVTAAALSAGLVTAWLCPANKRKDQLALPFTQMQHECSTYVIIQVVFCLFCSKIRSRREDHACVCVRVRVLDSNLQKFISFTVPQTPCLVLFSCSTITGPVGAVWLHSHRQRLDQEEEDYREPFGGINARCAGEQGSLERQLVT